MFTGIIEEVGIITRLEKDALVVRAALDDIRIGDSVAVNGVCLTAISVIRDGSACSIAFDYSPGTDARTALSALSEGSRVNLERALAANGRFGGHILTGHIEDTGTFISAVSRGIFLTMSFAAPVGIARYAVPRGSISVDGVSLTIAECSGERITISVIPHTLEKTTLSNLKPGSKVNLEPDILAKYVEHFLSGRAAPRGDITEELLKENGFL